MLRAEEKAAVLERAKITLSAEQQAILLDSSLVKLVAGGERAGKSRLGGAEIIANAPDASLIWIVGPEYEQAQAEFQYAYRDFQRLGALDGRASMPDQGQWQMRLKGGVEIETKTAQEVTRLAGKAPSGILMVEAGQQPFEVFLKLFARTAEGRARDEGWLALLGTFEKGRRWYAELFRQLQGPNQYGGRAYSDGIRTVIPIESEHRFRRFRTPAVKPQFVAPA